MMNLENDRGERNCALVLGILFLVVGIAGFIPAFLSVPGTIHAPATAEPSLYAPRYGYIMGLFPTNLIHNIVRCLVGFLGIAASTDGNGARVYCRFFAFAYALLAILGLLPYTNTLFGLMPIFGNNVWFSAVTAAIAAYFGFIKPAAETDQLPSTQSRT